MGKGHGFMETDVVNGFKDTGVSQDPEISGIFDKLKIIDDMYEFIRCVDPLMKKVIIYKGKGPASLERHCFGFWGKGKVCDNCISIRAINENKSFVKIEYNADRIFMVSAIPVELKDRRVVIELLKDVTYSLIFSGNENTDHSEVYAMIDNFNNLALRDALTEVYNRRYINEKLPIDLINSMLSGQQMTVMLADIDFFKKVNDEYGHVSGDCVLKKFAGVITGCIQRESDWVARYGGDEFLICLPGAPAGRAVGIAEKIRAAVEETIFSCGTEDIRITASFGICCVEPQQARSVDEIIQCADKKLYAAKRNGRNRFEI